MATVADNFPLIEGIIGLPFLKKKYKYNITDDFVQFDNKRILIQKLEEIIPAGEITQSTEYLDRKPTKILVSSSAVSQNKI